MRKLLFAISFLTLSFGLSAQYYIRGEVKDEKNQPLQNAKIYLHSNRLLYFSGNLGGFGILTSKIYDSLTFNADGYEPKCIGVKTDTYQQVNLKLLHPNINLQKQRLVSIAVNTENNYSRNLMFGNESYSNLVENSFLKADRFPVTEFSVRADKASYTNIRRLINQKSIVPEDAVRIEEMLNYFNLNYKQPDKNETFNIQSQLTSCPWNFNHQLLFINLSAQKLNLESVPPGNFVFLIDVSGSMDMPNRLPLLKTSFQSLVKNLRDKDTISIVTYGGSVGVWLPPTSGGEKQKIIQAIEKLNAEGDTPGEAAIRAAYMLARSSFIKGGNNRIILATDGDFNVGQTTEKELEELITKERRSGIYLTCLGVGMGNYKDSKIEALAKTGNGNFAYIDDIREGEKILVKELTQTLYTVATDVCINVQFNPEMVKEYRLIGYDNKKNVITDSASILEGGEIGSGNGITAVFEIIPTEENIYDADPSLLEDIATLKLNYRLPNDTTQKNLQYVCPPYYEEFRFISKDLQFASAITMFGLILRNSKYTSNVSWKEMERIAKASINTNDYLQSEFIVLADKAKKLYQKTEQKKKRLTNF
ncbi:MAG TPA: von Willebrand factor type A domain-containing protein [Chitinophagaceae bacterium]|nr:von Willebrand factor type A domain-containing protein [Chitinophagaceae bacterium]